MKTNNDGKVECIGVYLGKSGCIPMQGVKRRVEIGKTICDPLTGILDNAADESVSFSPNNTMGEEKEAGISACGNEPLNPLAGPSPHYMGRRRKERGLINRKKEINNEKEVITSSTCKESVVSAESSKSKTKN